jgi:hypothetical protein
LVSGEFAGREGEELLIDLLVRRESFRVLLCRHRPSSASSQGALCIFCMGDFKLVRPKSHCSNELSFFVPINSLFFLLLVVLGIEHKVLLLLGRHSNT